jgi:hypothetical protein
MFQIGSKFCARFVSICRARIYLGILSSFPSPFSLSFILSPFSFLPSPFSLLPPPFSLLPPLTSQTKPDCIFASDVLPAFAEGKQDPILLKLQEAFVGLLHDWLEILHEVLGVEWDGRVKGRGGEGRERGERREGRGRGEGEGERGGREVRGEGLGLNSFQYNSNLPLRSTKKVSLQTYTWTNSEKEHVIKFLFDSLKTPVDELRMKAERLLMLFVETPEVSPHTHPHLPPFALHLPPSILHLHLPPSTFHPPPPPTLPSTLHPPTHHPSPSTLHHPPPSILHSLILRLTSFR